MKQGRFGLTLMVLLFGTLLGCGLQTDLPSAKQTSRLMDELRAQTALKGKLQQELDQARAELAKLREEAAADRSDLAFLANENEHLTNESRELRKERDAHAASLGSLRNGIKSLLTQVEASLAPPIGAIAAK